MNIKSEIKCYSVNCGKYDEEEKNNCNMFRYVKECYFFKPAKENTMEDKINVKCVTTVTCKTGIDFVLERITAYKYSFTIYDHDNGQQRALILSKAQVNMLAEAFSTCTMV